MEVTPPLGHETWGRFFADPFQTDVKTERETSTSIIMTIWRGHTVLKHCEAFDGLCIVVRVFWPAGRLYLVRRAQHGLTNPSMQKFRARYIVPRPLDSWLDRCGVFWCNRTPGCPKQLQHGPQKRCFPFLNVFRRVL